MAVFMISCLVNHEQINKHLRNEAHVIQLLWKNHVCRLSFIQSSYSLYIHWKNIEDNSLEKTCQRLHSPGKFIVQLCATS